MHFRMAFWKFAFLDDEGDELSLVLLFAIETLAGVHKCFSLVSASGSLTAIEGSPTARIEVSVLGL